jgi:ketosteroid isomerase-like protein
VTDCDDDASAIAAVVEQYRRGFAALDPDALVDLWDPTFSGIIYVAQEKPEPLHGWAAVEDYYRALPHVIPVAATEEMRVTDLSVEVFGDVALAFAKFHFVGERRDGGGEFTADGRVTFVLRRTEAQWRMVHYHESAPLRT